MISNQVTPTRAANSSASPPIIPFKARKGNRLPKLPRRKGRGLYRKLNKGTAAQPAAQAAASPQVQTVQGTEEAISRGVQQWKDCGYVSHFTSVIGGKCDQKAVEAQLTATVRILVATYHMMCMQQGRRTTNGAAFDAADWMRAIVEDQQCAKTFIQYMDNMDRNKTAMPASVNVYLGYIIKSARWLVDYHHASDNSNRLQRGMDKFERLIKMIRTGVKRSVKIQQQQRDNSIATAIRNRKYPEGGLPQLQGAVREQLAFALDIAAQVRSGAMLLSSNVYAAFMAVLYCGIYVFAPNGRVGGKYYCSMVVFIYCYCTDACCVPTMQASNICATWTQRRLPVLGTRNQDTSRPARNTSYKPSSWI